jgi:hypothetical protein
MASGHLGLSVSPSLHQVWLWAYIKHIYTGSFHPFMDQPSQTPWAGLICHELLCSIPAWQAKGWCHRVPHPFMPTLLLKPSANALLGYLGAVLGSLGAFLGSLGSIFRPLRHLALVRPIKASFNFDPFHTSLNFTANFVFGSKCEEVPSRS